MSKEILEKKVKEIDFEKWTWNLYFFKVDRRSTNPFKVNKIKFKKQEYLTRYIQKSLDSIFKFQISNIITVEDYNGINTKISCDKISLKDTLISESWILLVNALAEATDEKIPKKVNGYIIEGQNGEDSSDNITLVKAANPIANLETKKVITFSSKDDDELDVIDDSIYRLYLTTDCIVFNENLYSFNHTFEKIFNLESSIKKNKEKAIKKILNINCFENSHEFEKFVSSYKPNKNFLTLNDDRLGDASTLEGRKRISKVLGIPLNEKELFCCSNQDELKKITDYLCFKIFKEYGTQNLIEASNAKKLNI